MKTKTKSTLHILQIIALFCIYLLVNLSVVHALAITHTPDSDVTVTAAEAEIRWTTDNASDSRVEYGEDSGLGSSESESDLVTDHSITLTGLGAALTYYYKLTSSTAEETATADNSGSLYSFATAASTDTAPPQFNVSLPEYYNRRQITFGGYTDPDSLLKLYVNANAADIGTDRYTQLTTSDSSGHFMFKYIALQAENTLVIWARDPAGNTNTATYTIKMDTDDPVVEITELPTLTASTSLTVNGTVNEDVTVAYSVNDDQNTEEIAAGSFALQLTLEEGVKNTINLQFADKAGNVHEKEHIVMVDTEGPTITWHNLDALDPSYIQEVDIKGNVSKPGATVIAFVNKKTYSSQSWSTSIRDMLVHYGTIMAEGDHEYSTTADKDGNFKMRVFLTQEIVTEKSEFQDDPYGTSLANDQEGPGGAPITHGTGPGVMPTVTTGPTGRYANAWDNHITIVVFDELGRSDERDGVVTFARCGYGADWNIQVRDPTPSVIIPEHLRQGIAQVAFAVKLDWQGPGTKQKLLREPVIKQYKLSEQMRQNYVFDPNELIARTPAVWDPNTRTSGYVIIELHKKDYEQKKLSEMKKEDLFIKLPMQIELEYEYDDGSGNVATSIQKQCWDVSVMLDVRIPPSVIPKVLLNASIIFLNNTIKAIDRILKPLKTITIAVFVTCLLGWVMYFFALMKKAYDCMDQKEGERPSKACEDSITYAKKIERYMHLVCDRIFCPSAPTADHYFQEMASEDCAGKPLTPEMTKKDGKCGQEYMDQWDSACLLMDELKRSQCIRYQAGDSRFSQSCGESGQLLKNAWYGASDFCRKKDEQTARRVSIKRGDEVEEYVIDEDGRAHRITSQVTVEQIEKKGNYVTSGQGGAQSTYSIGSLGEYSEGGTSYDDKIDYDGQGRLYYPTGSKEEDRQYLCENKERGNLQTININDRTGKLEDDRCRGGGPATLPRELMDNLDLPQTRTYVVDPTDNLLTALQCVCLPAISGFLTMWRNMLGAIMQCFQSILITGDGSSGFCRSVLTTYICDIVFSAIRCFVNKFGVSAGGRTKPDMGISKFFKSAATAGGDIRDSITNRYGETDMFKTMFSEKKLIHAACLWAFTGDFDFDVESMLTAPGAIPLQSKAFLYPRTRRFLSSNPLTGYSTHIYHIGAGLVAGADIGYKLQLVCSNTADCDIQEGFANGECDCYSLGREMMRDITYTFGPGNLIAGEMLGPNEGDIYVKIDGDKYRYDKVRLTYWEDGKAPDPPVEGKITQIGGKPPADCSFDLASGEFRCAFEIGDVGYAIFAGTPKPAEKLYGLGDTINLDFKVDKKSPQRQGDEPAAVYDQIPFYLRYVVASGGDTIAEKVIPIVRDGVQDFSDRSIPNIKVTEDILMERGVGKDYTVWTAKPPQAKSKISPSNYDSSSSTSRPHFSVYIKYLTDEGRLSEEELKKIDELREFEVMVCEGNFEERLVSGETKDFFKEFKPTCTKISGKEEQKEDLSFETHPLKRNLRIVYKGIKIDVRFEAVIGNNDRNGFIMRHNPGNVESSIDCRTRYTSATPAVITIKIGLYPCRKKDEDLPRSLTNCDAANTPVNYFNEVQEYEVAAEAVCSVSAQQTPDICDLSLRTSGPCECRKDIIGRNNCGEDNEKNYCFFAVEEYECEKYSSCPSSQPPNEPVLINKDTYATRITRRNIDYYYCDCKGKSRMDDCTNEYCYAKGGEWDCYPDPP